MKKSVMKKSNQFAHPFASWSGHRLFHVVAGTLVGAMAVTQASAMLPTPETVVGSPSVLQSNSSLANNSGSSAQAISSKIAASVVSVDANGRELLVPVTESTRLQSGNVLEYQGLFTNTNPDRVRKMTVTMTVPTQVEVIGGIAPDFPFGSVDGTAFARMPLRTNIDGKLQDVPLNFYRAVRWDLDGVGLNETVTVKYRARVK